jgi:hypothetical protein
MMGTEQLDLELGALEQAVERVNANLLDFELDSDRRFLDASTLSGEHAARLQAADAAVADLWQQAKQMEQLLARARGLRKRAWMGPQNESELRDLLLGKSVVLEGSDVPLAERPLLGEARHTLRLTPLELLERMSTSFEQAKTAYAAIAAELAEIAQLSQGFAGRLDSAREQLAALRALCAEGADAHASLRERIAVQRAPAPLQAGPELDAQLQEIARLAHAGDWAGAQAEMARFSDAVRGLSVRAQAIVTASRAPIETRNRLRGMLDAYQVKAGRLGLVEDPDLAELFARARDALYQAPTDLEQAGELVRRYQERVSGGRAQPEGPR